MPSPSSPPVNASSSSPPPSSDKKSINTFTTTEPLLPAAMTMTTTSSSSPPPRSQKKRARDDAFTTTDPLLLSTTMTTTSRPDTQYILNRRSKKQRREEEEDDDENSLFNPPPPPPPSPKEKNSRLGQEEYVEKKMVRMQKKVTHHEKVVGFVTELEFRCMEAAAAKTKQARKTERSSAKYLASLQRDRHEAVKKIVDLDCARLRNEQEIKRLQAKNEELKIQKTDLTNEYLIGYEGREEEAMKALTLDRIQSESCASEQKDFEDTKDLAIRMKQEAETELVDWSGKRFFEEEIGVPYSFHSSQNLTEGQVLTVHRRMRTCGFPGAEDFSFGDEYEGKASMWQDVCIAANIEIPVEQPFTIYDLNKMADELGRSDSDDDDDKD